MASKPTLQIASDDVRETVNKYCGILTVAEVIGLLDMMIY